MSQEQVIKVLEKLKQASVEEIARHLNIEEIAVRKNLLGMLRNLEVVRIELTKEQVESRGIRFSGRHYEWRLAKTQNEI